MLTETRELGQRTLYSNRKSQSTTLSNHLRYHNPLWAQRCAEMGIVQKPVTVTSSEELEAVQDSPFTLDGLLYYLARWIAADDQVRIQIISNICS
jgi:hypothetical protein